MCGSPSGSSGSGSQPGLRAGIGENVPTLGLPDVGRYRNHRDPGDQAPGDGQRGRRGGRGQHRDPVRAADPLGDRVGGPDHVTAAERDLVAAFESDGVLEIVATRDNGGV